MPRDLAISNGRLLVMFDRQYRIRDLYFPHVGKENHGAGHAFRFGVWVGGQFSWMGPEWTPEMRYTDSTMVTEVRARSGYTLDMTLDSSLFGLVMLGALPADDPQAVSTLEQVADRLWVHSDVGGLARYQNDYYQQVERQDISRVPGNPWFVCTMWLARYRLQRARTLEDLASGRKLLEWAAERALPSGTMAEQLRHAEYVRAVQEYIERHSRLNLCPSCGHAMLPTERRSNRQIVMSEV